MFASDNKWAFGIDNWAMLLLDCFDVDCSLRKACGGDKEGSDRAKRGVLISSGGAGDWLWLLPDGMHGYVILFGLVSCVYTS